MLSMEKARGLEGRGEGWEVRGRRGRGMLRKGRKRKGLAMGFAREGGGEEIMEPEEEWNDEDRGDLGDEADDAGESQTLMIGELVSLLSASPSSTLIPPTVWCLETEGSTDNIASLSQSSSLSEDCSPHWPRVFTQLEDVTSPSSILVLTVSLSPVSPRHLIGRHGRPMRVKLVLVSANRSGPLLCY